MILTFLGHQGWMVESPDFRLLIDPIICPYFRNSRHSRDWISPTRKLDLGRAGHIDAVYFTHEHEDHFHIESIDALDRQTALYLSANMSDAAERILREMGFESIERLFAFEELPMGEHMSLTVFPPPKELSERWVLQPFVKGKSYRDSFFNPVDCAVSPQFVSMLHELKVPEIGLVCMANNSQHPRTSHNSSNLRAERKQAGSNFRPAGMLNGPMAFAGLPGFRYLAIVGGGFFDESSPFGTFKCASQKRLAEILQEYSYDEALICGPNPGQYFDLEAETPRLHDIKEDSLVVVSPEADAAMRSAETKADLFQPGQPYDAATKRSSISAEEIGRLEQGLNALAAKLSASRFHAELMQQSVARQENGTWLPFGEGKLVLVLLQDDAPGKHLLYEYQPIRQRFTSLEAPKDRKLIDVYPFGFECWASDLLALCQGDLSVYEILKYRCRQWMPQQCFYEPSDFGAMLDYLFSPEVSSAVTYRLYRNAYERLGGAASANG